MLKTNKLISTKANISWEEGEIDVTTFPGYAEETWTLFIGSLPVVREEEALEMLTHRKEPVP